MKFLIKRSNFYFYSVLALALILVGGFFQLNKSLKYVGLEYKNTEKRVIKCAVPINNEMVQNVYYVTDSLQAAKQLLFNSKKGLFFDNTLYVKTTDFKGVDHIVAFKDIYCDAVGVQVFLANGSI